MAVYFWDYQATETRSVEFFFQRIWAAKLVAYDPFVLTDKRFAFLCAKKDGKGKAQKIGHKQICLNALKEYLNERTNFAHVSYRDRI